MFGETSLNQLLFLAYNLLKQENKNCKLKILAYQVSKSKVYLLLNKGLSCLFEKFNTRI